MPYEYSAQNHDWDLTLHAAAELINTGLVMHKQPTSGTLSKGFSFFTGDMILSFAAIESFSASVAFAMQSDDRFASFDFTQYRTTRRFWDRLQLLMTAAGVEINKSDGLFREIGDMQRWRNLVIHASPYEIEPTEIEDTIEAPGRLHEKAKHLDYTTMISPESAKRFYEAAVAFINLVRERTGLDPRASANYVIGV